MADKTNQTEFCVTYPDGSQAWQGPGGLDFDDPEVRKAHQEAYDEQLRSWVHIDPATIAQLTYSKKTVTTTTTDPVPVE